MDTAAYSPFALLPLRESRRAGDPSPAGTVELPSTVPVRGRFPPGSGPAFASAPISPSISPPSQGPSAVLESLRQKIARIERPSLSPAAGRSRRNEDAPWRLGCPDADVLLPSQGLETDSLHEIKAAARGHGASAGDWTAGLGFALRLAAMRLQEAQRAGRPAFMLWCWPRVMVQELGRLSGRGLMQFGLDPARVLIVETARESEALMALEEGMKSGTLALALELSIREPQCRAPLEPRGGRAPHALPHRHASRARGGGRLCHALAHRTRTERASSLR